VEYREQAIYGEGKMNGQKELNEFIIANMQSLFIPKKYKGLTYEEIIEKEFEFKSMRPAMNFACAIKQAYPDLKFTLIDKGNRATGVKFIAKGSPEAKAKYLQNSYKFRDKKSAQPIIDEALKEFTELTAIMQTSSDGCYYLRFEEEA